MRILFFSLCQVSMLLGISVVAHAQGRQPVKWYFEAEKISTKEAVVTLTAEIEPGWHIYSPYMEEGGPMPTGFAFKTSDTYKLEGKIVEIGEPIEKFDNTFMIPVIWFEDKAIFTQRIRLADESVVVEGSVEFMACMDDICLLPEKKSFRVEIGNDLAKKKTN